MKMGKYKFTIITVCYNAEKFIEDTIKSVLMQEYQNFEYIIKDGNSTDKTMDIVYSMLDEKENIRIISEKDNGIYDAMNCAVSQAMGQYVYFLNAGDCFENPAVLKDVERFLDENQVDVAYGDVILVKNENQSIRKYGKICSRKMYFLSGDCICHQAMFARTQLFENKLFDLRYKVCADKEWQLYHIVNRKKFMPMSFPIATVLVDGFSTAHVSDCEKETKVCVKKYCKKMSWIYACVEWMKHNPFLVRILRKAGEILFVRRKNEE